MSIKLRLVLLIATSLLTALIVSLVSYVGILRMATAVGDNTVSMSALRNHMEADMMHDALRADVYSAMLVGLGKSTATATEVRDSLAEHAGHFREVLDDNLKLPINPQLLERCQKLGIPLPQQFQAHPAKTDTPATTGTSAVGTRHHPIVPNA